MGRLGEANFSKVLGLIIERVWSNTGCVRKPRLAFSLGKSKDNQPSGFEDIGNMASPPVSGKQHCSKVWTLGKTQLAVIHPHLDWE